MEGVREHPGHPPGPQRGHAEGKTTLEHGSRRSRGPAPDSATAQNKAHGALIEDNESGGTSAALCRMSPARGGRCLHSPNTTHLADVTQTEDTVRLWTRHQNDGNLTQEGCEGSSGNAVNKKTWEGLKKQSCSGVQGCTSAMGLPRFPQGLRLHHRVQHLTTRSLWRHGTHDEKCQSIK